MLENPQVLEKHLIEKLREERLQQGFSYEKLAEITGLHRTTISLIERGKSHPTLLICLKIAKALNLDILNADIFNQK